MKRHSQRPLLILAVFLAAVAPPEAPSFAEAQARAGSSYAEEQRITAVDAIVEILTRKEGVKAGAGMPSFLVPADFEVLDGGEPRQVIDVGAFGPAQHAPDSEPWTFVVYFDRVLSSPGEASWAAGALVEAAERLTDLGRVEVVVADPAPRTVLDPTREAERLGSVLAEIALFPEGEDHVLLAQRDEYLGELANPASEIDHRELAAFAVAEERRIVARQLDGLLTHVASTGAGARRCLILASAGFDLRPEDFYRAHGGLPKRTESGLGTPEPQSILDALARSLAAYGWITFPLAQAADDASAAGLQLGKWRLGAPRGTVRETAADPLHPTETVATGMLNLLNLTRLGERDLEKADAYLELGETLASQGDHEEADQAFRMALYHLAEDPSTTGRQVKAWVGLGGVLELAGRRREARKAFGKARELDAESVPASDVALGELLEADRPLELLAEGTLGWVLESRDDLHEALAGLAYRVRVTFQVSGAPDGSLHPLAVRCLRKGCRIRAPAWTRSGTPEEVASSRIRRWLADDQFEGELELKARFVPESGGIEIETGIPEGLDGSRQTLRVTLGRGDPESIVELRHRMAEPRLLSDPPRWSLEVTLPDEEGDLPPAGDVAVLVEHFGSGRWGATLVEGPEEVAARPNPW